MEKDRFGDKLKDVERGREDKYFADRDRELVAKIRAEETEKAERAAAQMRCPKCGEKLLADTLEEVSIERCPGCNGLWLDAGELERIAKKEDSSWIARWLRVR